VRGDVDLARVTYATGSSVGGERPLETSRSCLEFDIRSRRNVRQSLFARSQATRYQSLSTRTRRKGLDDAHAESTRLRRQRWALRDRPRDEHAVQLEPEVVVNGVRAVMLNHVEQHCELSR
jgi:hypothetical protein